MSAPLPTPAELPRACATHPSRPPVALCRTCLAPACGECVTKVDGVNRCAACLVKLHPARARVPRGSLARSPVRIAFTILAYSFVSIAAAAFGVAMPFFALEARLEANRDRLVELHLKLSAYQNDVGAYPASERGLAALLVSEGEAGWSGPYTTARAEEGRPALDPKDEGKVLDVFGRPVLYFASEAEVEDAPLQRVYVASAGANGTWETPGITIGNPPREPQGDDALEWVAW